MNKLLLVVLLIIAAPVAAAYGVTFYSPEQNPQYGKVFEEVLAGKTYSFDVKKDIIAITGLEFRINRDVKSGGITVYTLTSPPDLPAVPDSGVYEFNELKYVGFVPHDTALVKYYYKVAKGWLANNSVNRNTIALHAFDSSTDTWEPLSTKIESEDEKFVYFSSPGVGYHYLYIGQSASSDMTPAKETVETEVESVEEPVTSVEEKPAPVEPSQEAQEVVDMGEVETVQLDLPKPQPVAPATQPAPVSETREEKEGGMFTAALVLLGIAVLGVIGYLLYTKRGVMSSVDKELHSYIKESLKRGRSKDEVRRRLQEVGWHEDRVEKALGRFKDTAQVKEESPVVHHTPMQAEYHSVMHKTAKAVKHKKAVKKKK